MISISTGNSFRYRWLDNERFRAYETVKYMSHKSLSDIAKIAKWLENNRLIINLKKGKTEAMLFGTASRLHSKNHLKVWMNNYLIHFVSRYKYLGVLLDPSLNMKSIYKRP